jgi:Carboxypeptidase regulatory-like domain
LRRKKYPEFAALMVMTLAGLLSASAAPLPGTVSGVVSDARGTPQMGAMVELMAANATVVSRVYTNMRGVFTFDQVFPGTYQVKATGDSFLPTLREGLRLRSRNKVVVNLTLSTLFEAIQWLPAQPRTPDEPGDDWKWTLRSSSNRPLLRLLQDGPLVVLSGDDHGSAPQLAARVAVHSSSSDFAQAGPHHAFAIERSSAVGGHLILRANLSPKPLDSSEYTAGYELALGPERQIYNVATIQQMSAVEGAAGGRGLSALRLRSAEAVNLGPNASLELGNEVQSVRGAAETSTSSLPFVNAVWHDDKMRVSYRLATSPEMQNAGDLADSATLAPMFTEQDGRVRMERGLHEELRLEGVTGSRRAMLAIYQDDVDNPVIAGGGSVSQQDLAGGNMLYDPLAQGFRVTGHGYTTGGVRASLAQKVGGSSWATVSYVEGKALAFDTPDSAVSVDEAVQGITQRKTQAITASLDGRLVRTGTRWQTSYRWQPVATITPVAVYDSFGQGAYLNLLVRQPIHCGHLLPNGTEALVDVRNLLAQGYRPFLTRDGSTLYFAQTERSIQGGLSFSF